MKFRAISLAATASLFTLVAGSAFAADLPVKAAPLAPAPVASWTGFYVGGNIGYGWADASASASLAGLNGSASESLNGVIGGGQIGYNYQAGSLVFGVEADIQGSGQSNDTSGTLLNVAYNVSDRIDYFGTVRGRLGYAMTEWMPDVIGWMPYVTGGWGYGEFNATATLTGVGTFDWSKSHGGWVVGGGVEWMFDPHWSGKLEYLYMDTGDMTTDYATALGALSITSHVTNNIVRVGANYHF